jgi:hypothetical protein
MDKKIRKVAWRSQKWSNKKPNINWECIISIKKKSKKLIIKLAAFEIKE